jgi:hypothetical protein
MLKIVLQSNASGPQVENLYHQREISAKSETSLPIHLTTLIVLNNPLPPAQELDLLQPLDLPQLLQLMDHPLEHLQTADGTVDQPLHLLSQVVD